MGFIASYTKHDHGLANEAVREAVQRGRAAWRELFATDKETGGERESRPRQRPPIPGGSPSRSVASAGAQQRLLAALKSLAPGGWSDDRYEQSARHLRGIAYIAIHRKCEQLQQAEFAVYEKDDNHPDGKRPVRKGHPGYKLNELLEKPNREDSFGDLLYAAGQQMDLTGTFLTYMVPNAFDLNSPRGQSIINLYPIPTALAIPQPAMNPDFPDGFYRIQPIYPYGPFSSFPAPASSVGAPIAAEWMVRVKYPHPLLRYDGYSPLTALSLQLDEIEGIDRSRFYSMKRAVNPSAVLNFDEVDGMQSLPDGEIDRIHAEWENEFQGPEAAGKLIVGTPGGKIEPWGGRPVDMDYPAGWDQLTSFALAGFGITKPAAGMVEDNSYSTLFATLKQLNLLTLQPMVDRIAAKYTRRLAPFFGDDLIIEIRCPRIDDHEIAHQKASTLQQCKAGTKNEVRKLLDLPVTKEDWGEEIAGAESQPQQGMPGAPGGMPGVPGGAPGQAGPPGASGTPTSGGAPPLPAPPAPEEQTRPRPGPLGAGSLGPRKVLTGKVRTKSLGGRRVRYPTYAELMKTFGNGHGGDHD